MTIQQVLGAGSTNSFNNWLAASSWTNPSGGYQAAPQAINYFNNNIYVWSQYQQTSTAGGLLTKYDSFGAVQFQKTINELEPLNGNVLFIDASENVYLAGITNPTFAGIAKLNSSGTIQWVNAYGTSTKGFGAQGVVVDSAGGVYALVSSSSISPQTVYFVKYNSSGTLQWQKNIAYSGFNVYPATLAIDSNDNIYVSVIQNSGISSRPSYLLKYNTSGTLIWQICYGPISGSGTFSAYNIVIGANNDIYTLQSASATSAVLTKINSSGTIQWAVTFSNLSTIYGVNSLTIDKDDNIYINEYENFTKVSSAGVVQWTINQSGGFISAMAGNKLGKLLTTGVINSSNPQIVTTSFPTDGSKPSGTYTIAGASITYTAVPNTASSYGIGTYANTLTESTPTQPNTSPSVTTTDVSFTQNFLNI
jgi:hypothetical protein